MYKCGTYSNRKTSIVKAVYGSVKAGQYNMRVLNVR